MLLFVKMAILLCVYAAAMYSCMRSCMEDSKAEAPALPGHWAFILSMFWFPLVVLAILADVFKGTRELFSEKK